jgi:hypothetical protein
VNNKKHFSTGAYVLVSALIVLVLYLGLRKLTDEDKLLPGSLVAEEIKPNPLQSEEANLQPELETVRKEAIQPLPDLAINDASGKKMTIDDTDVKSRPSRQSHIGAAAYKAVVSEGGALLTGGWIAANGSHVFVLMTPKPHLDSGEDVVELSHEVFAISREKMTDPRWEKLLEKNENGLHLNGATYDSDQLKEFRENYDSEISNRISAPRILTRYGQQASIEITGETDGFILSVIAEQNKPEGGVELAITVVDYGDVEGDSEQ